MSSIIDLLLSHLVVWVLAIDVVKEDVVSRGSRTSEVLLALVVVAVVAVVVVLVVN